MAESTYRFDVGSTWFSLRLRRISIDLTNHFYWNRREKSSGRYFDAFRSFIPERHIQSCRLQMHISGCFAPTPAYRPRFPCSAVQLRLHIRSPEKYINIKTCFYITYYIARWNLPRWHTARRRWLSSPSGRGSQRQAGQPQWTTEKLGHCRGMPKAKWRIWEIILGARIDNSWHTFLVENGNPKDIKMTLDRVRLTCREVLRTPPS